MNPDRKKIRWGILGCARIARESVMPAIQCSANGALHAVASRDETKLAESRAKFPEAKTYLGYAELLRDPEVDAVYIPLPNSLHREWTLRAIEQGKAVLCEKPIALHAAECREMIAASEAAGVPLMEAFMYRYTDRTRQVLAILRSGELGEIKFISASFRFLLANPASIKFQRELGGGSLYDVGCYPVNFIGMIVDEIAGAIPGTVRPVSIAAQAERKAGIDTIFSGLLRYESGLLAAVHSGFNAHYRAFAEIVGTTGVLEIPDPFLDHGGSLILTVKDARREIPVAASDRYRLEVEDFADALLQNRPPRLSLAETLRNTEIIDQLLAAT